MKEREAPPSPLRPELDSISHSLKKKKWKVSCSRKLVAKASSGGTSKSKFGGAVPFPKPPILWRRRVCLDLQQPLCGRRLHYLPSSLTQPSPSLPCALPVPDFFLYVTQAGSCVGLCWSRRTSFTTKILTPREASHWTSKVSLKSYKRVPAKNFNWLKVQLARHYQKNLCRSSCLADDNDTRPAVEPCSLSALEH